VLKPCPKKTHEWTLDGGRGCSRCGARRTRMPGTPELVALRFGHVYCQLCHETIRAGERVAWWWVRARSGRLRPAAYCATCHHSNVRRGRALG
jgi:hypothetical protein